MGYFNLKRTFWRIQGKREKIWQNNDELYTMVRVSYFRNQISLAAKIAYRTSKIPRAKITRKDAKIYDWGWLVLAVFKSQVSTEAVGSFLSIRA